MQQDLLFEHPAAPIRKEPFKLKLSPLLQMRHGRFQIYDPTQSDTVEERVAAFFRAAQERHAIYLRRAAGQPKPWTDEWGMQTHRFCNVYRELDTVSEWFSENVILPYEDHPDLWFMLCACRVINWPDTIADMMAAPNAFGIKGKYDADAAYAVLKDRQLRKEKVFTGAYLVNSVAQPDDPSHVRGDKAAFVTFKTLNGVWEYRKEIRDKFKDTLELACQTLRGFHGFGPFTAYQVVVDLSYSSKWLKNAKDYNQYNSPGPGTCRGLSRVFYGKKGSGMAPEERTDRLLELLAYSKDPKYWKVTSDDMHTGFAPLSLSNLSNWCCEFDKVTRLYLGEGKMKSKYAGASANVLKNRKSLF